MTHAVSGITDHVRTVRTAVQRRSDRIDTLVGVVFGDRHGLTLFAGGLWLLVSLWRMGIFITDTYALVNALVGMGNGHLWFSEAVFGGLDAPGTHAVDGRYYGRNYGQLFLSLPAYLLLNGASVLVDLRIAVLAGWCLLTLIVCKRVGALFDARRPGTVVGASAAGLLFVAGIAAGPRPVDPESTPILALQLTTMAVAAFGAVLLYRLFADRGRRLAAIAGVGLLVATPVTFWAHVPKRHVFTVGAVLAILYALHRSEHGGDRLTPTGYRCLAYATVGLYTWVQAAEGLLLFLGLLAADARTLRTDDYRTAGIIFGAFVLSLVPFLATNYLVTGQPWLPPRLWPDADAVAQTSSDAPLSPSEPSGTSRGSSTIFDSVRDRMGRSWVAVQFLGERLVSPLVSMVSSIDYYLDLYPVYVRSGYIESDNAAVNQAIQLSVFESAPVVAGAGAMVVAGLRRVRQHGRDAITSLRSTDLFALVTFVLFTGWYSTVLPVHAQITVRYLLVVYPLLLYAVLRQRPVRRALTTHFPTVCWTYLAGALLGTQLFVVAVVLQGLGRGEAFQLHALVNLGLAAVFTASATAGLYTDRTDRLTAASFALAAAATTAFLVLSKTSYFQYGSPALPLFRVVSDVLTIV